MKTFIFTDKERQTIKNHLKGEPVDPNLWGVLKHRIKKHNPGIQADIDLMMKVLTSIQKVEEKETK
ncbi:MAG: hypothetical protein ABIK27_03630 [Bacteroidota bacterium]|uniref:Uncharacterized protein n=1 Tax=viral metagenome TaxID=1070528 RepID=A0A6M3MDH5_9ZZZZ